MSRGTYIECRVCGKWSFNKDKDACENEACPGDSTFANRDRSTPRRKPKPISGAPIRESDERSQPAISTAKKRPQPTPATRRPPRSLQRLETFPRRAIRLFFENLWRSFAGAFGRIRRSREYIRRSNERIARWEKKHPLLAGLLLMALMLGGAGLLSLWWKDYLGQGRFGKLLQYIILALPILSLFVTRAISAAYQVIAPIVFSLLLILWLPVYALIQLAIMLAKFLLLLPLAVISVFGQLIQLWRRIFYTCPSRQCAYRGAPRYVCPDCGESNPKLWPNLYGPLWHRCMNCDAMLPALGPLGRDKLQRRCGGCQMPLDGKHAGRATERLVAIVGASGSGKTNYALMAAGEIINNHHPHPQGAAPIRGEIDDHTQAEEFEREWRKLTMGVPADKTSEVTKALLLYAKVGASRCQLYLYDAPGEEFTSIGAMTRQQYFHLLEGIVLLVDPLSFESMRAEGGAGRFDVTPLQDVVASILGWAASGAETGRGGKMKLRVAAVISKADLPGIGKELGANEPAQATSAACRAALVKWGGGNAVNALEHHFESVEYFACSPLGRAVETYNRQPFQGRGVLQPLAWVLNANTSSR